MADRNGRQLGHAAASALEALPPPATTFAYAGIVRSGANLGAWEHRPSSQDALAGAAILRAEMLSVELETKAFPSSDVIRARIAANTDRVEGEKLERLLLVRQAIGEGGVRSLPLRVWRLGDAVVVAIPDEPYSILQQELRRAFPANPILVLGVTNGAVGYLCPREYYGTGRYQEIQSPYAPGCLERLSDAARRSIAAVLEQSPAT